MRAYVRPMPSAWWLRSRAYTLFLLRELTSVFIGGYALLLLLLLRRLAAGGPAYGAFLRGLASPWVVLFLLLALAAAVFHSVTWFRLAPMAVVVRLRGRRVPDRLVVGAAYAAWAGVSLIVGRLLLWR